MNTLSCIPNEGIMISWRDNIIELDSRLILDIKARLTELGITQLERSLLMVDTVKLYDTSASSINILKRDIKSLLNNCGDILGRSNTSKLELLENNISGLVLIKSNNSDDLKRLDIGLAHLQRKYNKR